MILLLSAMAVSMGYAEDRAGYNSGLEKYRQKQNKEALALFQNFITLYPDSVKADDAKWYMGRIYIRMNREEEAEKLFREVLQDSSSNRFEEASYDLSKILYTHKKYSEVTGLLSFIDTIDDLNYYHIKGLELAARAWYRMAYRQKINYNEEEAGKLFSNSLLRYKRMEPLVNDETDLSRIHFTIAEIYSHMADITYESGQYQAYRDDALKYLKAALPMISDFYRDRAEQMLAGMEKSQKTGFSGRITAYGGADNLSADTFGTDIYARGTLFVPAPFRNRFYLNVSFKHNGFDFVTSNFDPSKTEDDRLVQYSDTFGANLTWKNGTRRKIYNKLQLFSDYQTAEDNRDNYLSAGMSDSGSVRFGRPWRFSWDSMAEWRTYPNYLVSGRKLDYVKGSLAPSVDFLGFSWADISLVYGMDMKQYLDSKYDTSDPTVASTEDKLLLYNSGELIFNFKFNRIYKPVLSYKFNYLKSFNYDYWAPGLPSDRFIEGYYDYISNSVNLKNNLKLNDKLKVSLGSEVVFTNFLNYQARDASKTFIDQLRTDTALKLDLGARYLFWASPGGTEMEARLSGWWNYKTSNMTYNSTFVTNYSYAGLMLGVSARMP